MTQKLFSQAMHLALFATIATFMGLRRVDVAYGFVALSFLAGVSLPSPFGGGQP